MPPFEDVWGRIIAHVGERFETITGVEFTYLIDANCLLPSTANQKIGITNIKKAFSIVPFDGPGVINKTVRGPAYVWAILHDPRIRQNDW